MLAWDWDGCAGVLTNLWWPYMCMGYSKGTSQCANFGILMPIVHAVVKKAVTAQFVNPMPSGTATAVTARMDPLGNPVQTSQFGLCKCPGCKFPRRVENGHVHDFCSRTCARKYDAASSGTSAHDWVSLWRSNVLVSMSLISNQ